MGASPHKEVGKTLWSAQYWVSGARGQPRAATAQAAWSVRVVALLRGSQGCSCGVSGLLMEAEDVVVLTSANKSEGIVVAEGGGACLDSTGSFDSRHLRDAVREVAAKGILQQWIQHPRLSLAGAGYCGSTQMASGDRSIRRRAVQH